MPNFGNLVKIVRRKDFIQTRSINTGSIQLRKKDSKGCEKLGCKNPVCKKGSPCKIRPPYVPPPPKCDEVKKLPNCIIGSLPCCPEVRNPPDCTIPQPQPPCIQIPNPAPCYSEMIKTLPPKPYTECDCWNPSTSCI